MNAAYKPDFVVNCGDMVEDIDQKHDEKNFAAGVKILSRLKCPVYHIIGNHDQRNLSDDFMQDTLNSRELFYMVDKDGYRLIFLITRQFFRYKSTRLNAPYVDQAQLNWLKQAVNTDKQIIIFSHASLVPVDTVGNFWFEDDATSAYIKNHQEFQEIIRGKNVKLAFNGHLHWNKLVKLGAVNYFSIQSLVENTSGKLKGSPANAYALINIHDGKVAVDIKGSGGISYLVYEETH